MLQSRQVIDLLVRTEAPEWRFRRARLKTLGTIRSQSPKQKGLHRCKPLNVWLRGLDSVIGSNTVAIQDSRQVNPGAVLPEVRARRSHSAPFASRIDEARSSGYDYL